MSDAKYMWLSFRDPENNVNLGVCIVEATDFTKAVDKAWELGINPGGEIGGYSLNQEQFEAEELGLNKLYSRQDMIDLGYTAGG